MSSEEKKNKPLALLVTGALGHIGSRFIRHCVPELVSTISMLDNLESQRYVSLFHLPNAVRYRFYEDDVRTADMKKYLNGVDAVVHLAAITNAEASFERAAEVEAVNLNGLKRVADVCLETGVRLFFPSTTSVYGSQAAMVDETCIELKPQSPYAESKLAAEEYLKGLRSKGLRFVVCRFGTIFGPSHGMRFHTAVNKFIWQAVNGIPLSVWRTAWNQKRPYLDLDDCIRAINFILEQDACNGEIYNVLTQNYTVEEIVNAIREFIPSLEVRFVDSPIMNQLSYEADDRKIKTFGFAPKGDLRRGIAQTIEYLKGIA